MTKINAAYVPDDLWTDFRSGVIDHFEYGDPAVAVYADGRRLEFDATVTPEIVRAEKELWEFRMRNDPRFLLIGRHTWSTVLKRRTGVITGWTA